MALDNYEDLTEEELATLRGDNLEDEEELDEDPIEDEEELDEDPIEEEVEDPKIAALAKQNAWLEEQLSNLIKAQNFQKKEEEPQKPKFVYDFEAKEEEYANLIIEGEVAKASKLRTEINNAHTSKILEAIKEESKESEKTTRTLLEDERFNKTIEILEERHPFLNPDNKAYNAEAVDTANALMKGFVAKGDTRTEALKKAVARIIPFYSKDPKDTVVADRKGSAGKVAVDASKRQPPKTSGVKGVVPTKTKPIEQMSDKEFAALTPAQLRELRGDM